MSTSSADDDIAADELSTDLMDCDRLVEKYAKFALDFTASDHGNEPGLCAGGLRHV